MKPGFDPAPSDTARRMFEDFVDAAIPHASSGIIIRPNGYSWEAFFDGFLDPIIELLETTSFTGDDDTDDLLLEPIDAVVTAQVDRALVAWAAERRA